MNDNLKSNFSPIKTLIKGGLVIAAGLILKATQQEFVYADAVTSQASVTVSAACYYSDITIDGNYSVSITPGDYNDNIGNHNFQIFCNDNNGFSVYAIGYSNDEYGNTNMISSNSSNSNIATGLATSGANSNWAMKISSVAGSYAPTISNGTNGTEDFTTFHSVPNIFTKIASFSSATNTTVGSQLQSTYRIYVSPTQPADTYTGKVKYTLVHPGNTLVPTTSISQAYASAGKSKVTVGTNSYYVLQDMNTSICSAVDPIGSDATVTEVVDVRDNNIYKIAKLEDGNCWMLDNLALDLTNSDVQTAMLNATDTKTNATYSSLSYLFNGGGTILDQFAIMGVDNWGSSSSFSSPLINLDSKDDVYGAMPGSQGNNKVGGYYNYCSASAGTYCWGNNTGYSGSPEIDLNPGSNLDVVEDICPSGWRLPTGGPTGEYIELTKSITGASGNLAGDNYTLFRKAFSVPLSGNYGSVNYQNSRSYFWTSTWSRTSYMRRLYVTSTTIEPTTDYSRHNGISIRCIAK